MSVGVSATCLNSWNIFSHSDFWIPTPVSETQTAIAILRRDPPGVWSQVSVVSWRPYLTAASTIQIIESVRFIFEMTSNRSTNGFEELYNLTGFSMPMWAGIHRCEPPADTSPLPLAVLLGKMLSPNPNESGLRLSFPTRLAMRPGPFLFYVSEPGLAGPNAPSGINIAVIFPVRLCLQDDLMPGSLPEMGGSRSTGLISSSSEL